MYTQHVKNDTVRLIADDKIPFLRGVPESLGFETVYLPGKDISAGDVREADALMVRTRTRCDEALLHGSPDDVSEALESHLSRYKQSVAQARSVHPEYFIDE